MDFSERIKKPIPQGLNITPGTTPVIYFGAYSKAKACTISINPSDKEFYLTKGDLLSGNNARLCSRALLGKTDSEVLSDSDVSKVLEFCEGYFDRNPYTKWFNKYEHFLNVFNFSYYEKSVVHLDLVQWATTPFWKDLSNSNRNSLLCDDLPCLTKLLQKNFEYIFLNGRTVSDEISKSLGLKLRTYKNHTFNGRQIEIYFGSYGSSKVIGWSPYLQSAAVGGYEKIREFAGIIKSVSVKYFTN